METGGTSALLRSRGWTHRGPDQGRCALTACWPSSSAFDGGLGGETGLRTSSTWSSEIGRRRLCCSEGMEQSVQHESEGHRVKGEHAGGRCAQGEVGEQGSLERFPEGDQLLGHPGGEPPAAWHRSSLGRWGVPRARPQPGVVNLGQGGGSAELPSAGRTSATESRDGRPAAR